MTRLQRITLALTLSSWIHRAIMQGGIHIRLRNCLDPQKLGLQALHAPSSPSMVITLLPMGIFDGCKCRECLARRLGVFHLKHSCFPGPCHGKPAGELGVTSAWKLLAAMSIRFSDLFLVSCAASQIFYLVPISVHFLAGWGPKYIFTHSF
jgi:hypothetical protein